MFQCEGTRRAPRRVGSQLSRGPECGRTRPAGVDPADPQESADDRGGDFLHASVVQDFGVRHRNAEDPHRAKLVFRFVATLDLGWGAGRLDGGERL